MSARAFLVNVVRLHTVRLHANVLGYATLRVRFPYMSLSESVTGI